MAKGNRIFSALAVVVRPKLVGSRRAGARTLPIRSFIPERMVADTRSGSAWRVVRGGGRGPAVRPAKTLAESAFLTQRQTLLMQVGFKSKFLMQVFHVF